MEIYKVRHYVRYTSDSKWEESTISASSFESAVTWAKRRRVTLKKEYEKECYTRVVVEIGGVDFQEPLDN